MASNTSGNAFTDEEIIIKTKTVVDEHKIIKDQQEEQQNYREVQIVGKGDDVSFAGG